MAILEHPTEEQSFDPEALIQEARHRRHKRWAIGSAIVIAAASVVTAVSFAGSGGAGTAQLTVSAGSAATPPSALLAALKNVPAALRSALVSTLEARSYEIGEALASSAPPVGDDPWRIASDEGVPQAIYNAPNKTVVDESRLPPCSATGSGLQRYFLGIIGSTEYGVRELCPQATYSIEIATAPSGGPGSYGLNAAQVRAFWPMVISILQGSTHFVQTSSVFTFHVKPGALPSAEGVVASSNVLDEAQIQHGYLTGFTYYTQGQGSQIAVEMSFWDFGAAPTVEAPTLPLRKY